MEHLESKVETPFSDLDASNDVSVGKVPEGSASSKKQPALPLSKGQSAWSTSDDSDYEVDERASLEQGLVRKLPAKKSRPVGSFAKK